MRNPAISRALLAALLLLAPAACAPALARPPAEPTTVVVVRHAERASEEDPDPPLSAAGEARAAALADALADAGVTRVIATQFQRTRDTALPLAERLGLPVTVERVEDAAASSEALARKILSEHAGETVLVVGHSNTVPLIVRALGGSEVPPLQASDYDRLFVVVVPAGGPARTLQARYGEGVNG